MLGCDLYPCSPGVHIALHTQRVLLPTAYPYDAPRHAFLVQCADAFWGWEEGLFLSPDQQHAQTHAPDMDTHPALPPRLRLALPAPGLRPIPCSRPQACWTLRFWTPTLPPPITSRAWCPTACWCTSILGTGRTSWRCARGRGRGEGQDVVQVA